MTLELDDVDAALIILGLLLTEELLFKSRYHPDLQSDLKTRADSLRSRVHDARNPPQHNSSPDEDPVARQTSDPVE